jgi:hypothetical protein
MHALHQAAECNCDCTCGSAQSRARGSRPAPAGRDRTARLPTGQRTTAPASVHGTTESIGQSASNSVYSLALLWWDVARGTAAYHTFALAHMRHCLRRTTLSARCCNMSYHATRTIPSVPVGTCHLSGTPFAANHSSFESVAGARSHRQPQREECDKQSK